MEQWTNTLDRRVAIAMGTLGVIVRIENTHDDRSGDGRIRYHLSLANLEQDVNTKQVIHRWKSGALEKDQPGHPFLTVLRADENRLQLLDCAHRGTRIRLVRVPGTDVWQYLPAGDGLPGLRALTPGQPVIETGDLKMAAALATAGLRLLAISGTKGNFLFHLEGIGGPRLHGLPPVDGIAFLQAWRRDMEEVPWQEPFAQAARGLYNRERMLDSEKKAKALILIRKPRSVKAALIHEDATDAAWDKMKREFDA